MSGISEYSGEEGWLNFNESHLTTELTGESLPSFSDQIPAFDIDDFIEALLPATSNEASPPKLSLNKDFIHQPEVHCNDSFQSPCSVYPQPFAPVSVSTPISGCGAPFDPDVLIDPNHVGPSSPLAGYSMNDSGIGDSLYNTPAHAPSFRADCIKTTVAVKPSDKPQVSYMEIIARALLDSPSGRLLLTDIYHYAKEQYPYFRSTQCAWRNSIRHNLSVNECFVKASRSRTGRGFYWEIHHSCISDFRKGDFNRRLVRKKVQWSERSNARSRSTTGVSTNARLHEGQVNGQTQPDNMMGGHSRLAYEGSSASVNYSAHVGYMRSNQDPLAINMNAHQQQSSYSTERVHTNEVPMQGANQHTHTIMQINSTAIPSFVQPAGYNMLPQYSYAARQSTEAPVYFAPMSTTSPTGFQTQ